MASRITTYSEYTISSVVSDVRTIESQTYPGVSVIKIYFQPNVNVEAALAQVTSVPIGLGPRPRANRRGRLVAGGERADNKWTGEIP